MKEEQDMDVNQMIVDLARKVAFVMRELEEIKSMVQSLDRWRDEVRFPNSIENQ